MTLWKLPCSNCDTCIFLLWLHLKRNVKLRKFALKPVFLCLLHFNIASSICKIHCHDASQYCTYLGINFQKDRRKSLQFCKVQSTLFPLSFLDTILLLTFSNSLRICIAAYQRGCIKSSCCGVLLRTQKLILFFYSLMLC